MSPAMSSLDQQNQLTQEKSVLFYATEFRSGLLCSNSSLTYTAFAAIILSLEFFILQNAM